MPVSVSSAGISLTLSPYGHSPYHIYDEQRERSPDSVTSTVGIFQPLRPTDTSPIFCIAKHKGKPTNYFYISKISLYLPQMRKQANAFV